MKDRPRLRELLKLIRMRIPWCQLIHWLAWRVACYEAETNGAACQKEWGRVAAVLCKGGGRAACEYVVDELRRHIRDGTLRQKARWE